mmetsp:Transcript_51596/g.95488  ORF Transcript_51596/g.95488 Transcript_51596/m.95488 type:complete len:306 (-) Transcript_51596:132-1049(-)
MSYARSAGDENHGLLQGPQSMAMSSGQRVGVAECVYRAGFSCLGELLKCVCCLPTLLFKNEPMITIDQGSVGVLTHFGVFERVLDPGMYVVNIMSQKVIKVSTRMQTLEIPKQAAMTRDNLSVNVDAVAFITVSDPVRATFQVVDYVDSVRTLAASTLLRVIGEHDLQQIFHDRAAISESLKRTMEEKTKNWGLELSGVEMRDIKIPDGMQRTMAQIAEANREAQSKVIVAEGQRKAASILVEAAAEMNKQPVSLQLQWFETLRQIATEKNSTVVVPDSIMHTMATQFVGGVAAGSSMPPQDRRS